MIDLTGMISIPYLKKTTFTGSEKGTNFMIRKISGEEGEPDKIQAVTWPGPFIFSVTEDEKKTYQEFEFSEDGIKAAVAWLNEVTHSALLRRCSLHRRFSRHKIQCHILKSLL